MLSMSVNDIMIDYLKGIKKSTTFLISTYFVMLFLIIGFYLSIVGSLGYIFDLKNSNEYMKNIFASFQTFGLSMYFILIIIIGIWYILLNIFNVVYSYKIISNNKLGKSIFILSILSIFFLFLLGNIIVIILINIKLGRK